MEKKVIKLTEQDLVNLVEATIKRVTAATPPIKKPVVSETKTPRKVTLSEKELVSLIEATVERLKRS